jgi:hypothetical protein
MQWLTVVQETGIALTGRMIIILEIASAYYLFRGYRVIIVTRKSAVFARAGMVC